jgi:YidC/Oxa1 family membrane protein insertase
MRAAAHILRMDKSNTLIGGALIAAAIVLYFVLAEPVKEPDRGDALEPEPITESGEALGDDERVDRLPAREEGVAASGDTLFTVVEDEVPEGLEIEADPDAPETFSTLENEFVRVVFTNRGGAIREVDLKYYPIEDEGEEPYTLHVRGDVPALSLSTLRGERLIPFLGSFTLTEQTAQSVTFAWEGAEGIRLERTFTLGELGVDDDGPTPYLLEHSTRITNTGEQALAQSLYLNVGTAAPKLEGQEGGDGRLDAQFLNVGYSRLDDVDFVPVGKFLPSGGFLGFGAHGARPVIAEEGPISWTSVKNQFFVSILTPEIPGSAIRMRAIPLGVEDGKPYHAVTGDVAFAIDRIEPGETQIVSASWYAGPKEYPRLEKLDRGQDAVMQFGWFPFSFIAKLFVSVLNGLESFLNSYGLAIVCLVVIIRLLLWPITAKAAQSARRMQTLQPALKELQAKYKDKPERMQKEMMAFWKENKINPAAGCLPMFLQFPIFIGLFYMLRSASELRFESFLWVTDLSRPDTIAEIGGFPINPLPLLMAFTMWLQMRMSAASMQDKTQRMIFQLMPLVMLLFLYNFSSGLALYWTVSNCFSILQQYLTNKKYPAHPPGTPLNTATATAGAASDALPAPAPGPAWTSPRGKKRKKKS